MSSSTAYMHRSLQLDKLPMLKGVPIDSADNCVARMQSH